MTSDHDPDWLRAALARAAADERAPARLREQIDALSRRPSRRRPRWVLIPALGAACVCAIVLALVLPGGAPGGPTVAQAAALGLSSHSFSATTPGPGLLYARFGGVRFPQGLRRWRVVGETVTRLEGREILNISYSHASRVIVYRIAARPLLRGQRPGFRSFPVNGGTAVSWSESGHSCLLVSAGVARTSLVRLARS